MERVYFARKDSENLTGFNYGILCLRFACEAYGTPVFGAFNERVLEFLSSEAVTEDRRKVLDSEGFVEVTKPVECLRRDVNLLRQAA